MTVPSHERWRSFIYSLGVSILPLRTTVCFIGFWNCSGSVIFFVFILYFHFLMPFTFRIRYYNESLWEETFDIAMRVYERKHSILQWEFMRRNIRYYNESLWEETFDITMRVYERKHSILQWEFMRGNVVALLHLHYNQHRKKERWTGIRVYFKQLHLDVHN